MPPLPYFHHLKSDDVQAVDTEHLQVEVLRLVVEDRDVAVVRDQHRRCRDAIPDRLPRENPSVTFASWKTPRLTFLCDILRIVDSSTPF